MIDSVEDFVMMRDNRRFLVTRGKYFKLDADIDLSQYTDWDWPYYHHFNGHLDGQNHTVTVNINQTYGTYGGASLFHTIESDGIALRNLNVRGTVHGQVSAAGIVYELSSGIIDNCRFDGTVEVNGSNLFMRAGGIVCRIQSLATNAIVRNCNVRANISALREEEAKGFIEEISAGGIVAFAYRGLIENCRLLSGSSISSSYSAGGIAGVATNCKITNCVAEASLEGSVRGGIVGYNSGEGYTLLGNTWPSQYPEVGNTSSSNTVQDQPSGSALPVGRIQPFILSQDTLDKVARAVSTDISQIHILTASNISAPQDPTQAMRDYIKNDNAELLGKLNTIKVNAKGWYVFKVTLTDELFEQVRGQKVSGFKFYGLHDSEAQVSASFITGFLNTVELLTMNGDKLDTFGVREFLMVGLLNAGTPFSVYLTKIILALLAGGCNTGIFTGSLAVLAFTVLLFRKH